MALNIFKKENKSKNPLVGRSGADVTMVPAAPSLGIKNSGVAISALGRSVLVAPHVTEKAARLESVGQYVFRVHPAANQIQIRQAVETAYQVKVAGVQVVKIPAKTRRLGKHVGLKAGYKKAIVSLRPGDKIQLIAK